MDGRNDMLRELCDESDGYVTTDQLRQLIDDPCMLKTALSTLDANNTGRIPFEKLANLLAVSDEYSGSENLSDLQRSCSSSDDHDQTFQEYDYEKTTDDDSSRILSDVSPTVKRRPLEADDDYKFQISQRRSNRKSARFRRSKSGDPALDLEDLSDQVSSMRGHIAQIEESEQMKSHQLESSRLENIKLRNRIHELEEFLRDAEQERDMFREQSLNTTQESVVKLDRESRLSIELLTSQVNELQSDNERLHNDVDRLRSKNEKYKCDLNNQSIKLDEYQQRAVVQIEKYQLLTERAAVEREELQQQNRAAQDRIEQHKAAIDELEHQKIDLATRLNLRMRDVVDSSKENGDLEVNMLQDENQRLNDLVEDLNVQLLNQHVVRARALSGAGQMCSTFADEVDEATKDQIEEKYRKLQSTHNELRMYLERILANIMDRDPTLLEITR